MDAYLPACDTLTPSIVVPAKDQPWHVVAGTQSLFWRKVPAPSRVSPLSSHPKQVTTFAILEGPAHAGLERLRAFRGWTDNWDAEGAKAPDPNAIDFASKVFGLLALHRTPEVTLNAEGHPMFIYGTPLNGEVVVTGPGTIDYFFAHDDAPEGENVALEGVTLPTNLVSFLHTAA